MEFIKGFLVVLRIFEKVEVLFLGEFWLGLMYMFLGLLLGIVL